MALEVRPSRVIQGGPSPQAALAVVLVALFSMIGFALLGKAYDGAPPSSAPAALAAPSQPPTPHPVEWPEAAWVSGTSAPLCVEPRIVALDGRIAPHPRPLIPTGFQTLTPWMGADVALVADREAGFWAFGWGRLTRLDATGKMNASWTFADDEVFGASGIVAARQGGVWLWGGPTIAWFDGERLRDVIGAPRRASGPSTVVDVAEAADGSLWAATFEGGVFHWDGRSWSELCDRTTPPELSHLAIDAGGWVWVAPAAAIADASYFDGTEWSSPPAEPAWADDPSRVDAWVSGLAAADDGSLWVAAGGVAHFDGKSWTSMRSEDVDLSGTVSLAAAPDGTVWVATGSVKLPGDGDGLHTGIAVAHFDGRSWMVYGAAQGLPAPGPSNWTTITLVAASRDAVVAATRDGFYRLSGGRWERTGPRPTTAVDPWSQKLLAVSDDEAWMTSRDAGLWHVQDGTWADVGVAGWKPPVRVWDVAGAPDGSLAVATDHGAAVLRSGRWTILDRTLALAVTFARDGTIWVAGTVSDSTGTHVASFRFDGRAWKRTVVPPVVTPVQPFKLVVPRDGALWLYSRGWGDSLDRFDGTDWVRETSFGGFSLPHVAGLAVAPNGDLWAALVGGDPGTWAVARRDGATWTVHLATDVLAEPGDLAWPRALAIAPDSTVWVATDRGLVQFNGGQSGRRFAGYQFADLSFAPDGTLWAVGPSGLQRLPAGRLVGPEPAAR